VTEATIPTVPASACEETLSNATKPLTYCKLASSLPA